MDGAVGAHGHGGAEDVDGLCGTGGECDDFGNGGFFAFADADGGFDGEFVEGVHAVFDAGGLDRCPGFIDAGFDLLVGGGGLLVGGVWDLGIGGKGGVRTA